MVTELNEFQKCYLDILNGKGSPSKSQLEILDSHLKEQSEEYTDDLGNSCRWCGHNDIQYGSMEFDSGSATVDATCSRCQATWEDYYKLDGFINFEATDEFLFEKKLEEMLKNKDDRFKLYELVGEYMEKDCENLCGTPADLLQYLFRKTHSYKELYQKVQGENN